MSKENVILSIRLILTTCLCYAIYGEAGPFTAFAFFLLFVTCEMITGYIRKVNKLVVDVYGKLTLRIKDS